MKTQSAKQKGKDFENYIADQIRDKGIDPRARRDGASGAGTREKGDINTSMMINGVNVGIECKNWKTASVKDWWRQAQKLQTLRREPVVAYKLFGEPMGEAKAIIYFDTLLELVKLASGEKQIVEVTPEDSRDKKYKIQRAITTLKELLKEYE